MGDGRAVDGAGSCLLGNSDDCREGNDSSSANHLVAIKTQARVIMCAAAEKRRTGGWN